mmetsp:Transcript_12021/g.26211  ORF Transcript_12021/g.26211 Transcript_12021/m.26211 type:complete len:119 (+) Transcript_12021:308-664(+)
MLEPQLEVHDVSIENPEQFFTVPRNLLGRYFPSRSTAIPSCYPLANFSGAGNGGVGHYQQESLRLANHKPARTTLRPHFSDPQSTIGAIGGGQYETQQIYESRDTKSKAKASRITQQI